MPRNDHSLPRQVGTLRVGILMVLGVVLAGLLVTPGRGEANATAVGESANSPSHASPLAKTARTGSHSLRLRVRKTKVAGTMIAWAELGRGRPLLLLNGTGSPMSQWDPLLLTHLSKHRRVIVFDYPGLGSSGRAPAKITFKSLARWSAKLLKRIGVRRADVLGWSMGGFVAQEMLHRHPKRVRRAVLAGTNPGGPWTELGPRWAQRIDSDPNAGIRGYLKTNYPRTKCGRSAGRRAVQRINTAIRDGRYPTDHVPTRTYRAMVRAENHWLRSSRNSRAMQRVKHQVLVTTGMADVVTPVRNSQEIAQLIPKASLLIFKGSGHSFLFQQPKRAAGFVHRFLKGKRVGERISSGHGKRVVGTRCT